MRLNNNTFQNYFAVLNDHVIDTKRFYDKTEQLLVGDEIVNLFSKEIPIQILKNMTLGKEITTAEKIFGLLKDISISNKFYQNKLSMLVLIFDNIIPTINSAG